MRASLCLLDPVKLKNKRYTKHETFIDQIQLADVLVANKVDLADAMSIDLFNDLAKRFFPAKAVIAKTVQGKLNIEWLKLPADPQRQTRFPDSHRHASDTHPKQSAISGQAQFNAADGYQSCGWFFTEQQRFDYDRFRALLGQLAIERCKGLIATDRGWFIVNANSDQISLTPVDEQASSRLEMIAEKADWKIIENRLNECLVNRVP